MIPDRIATVSYSSMHRNFHSLHTKNWAPGHLLSIAVYRKSLDPAKLSGRHEAVVVVIAAAVEVVVVVGEEASQVLDRDQSSHLIQHLSAC